MTGKMLALTLHILGVLCCLVTVASEEIPVACKTCKCSLDKQFGGVLVCCSDRGLVQVPTRLPPNTTTLLFDGNDLKKLQRRMVVKLEKLKRLDVSRNGLMYLEENSFLNLSNLEELNLESNHLTYNNSVFKQQLFKPLSNLRILKINNNSDPRQLPPEATYPDSSFQYLTSLQELYMDGLPTDFGPGFLKLTRLKRLTLSGGNGYCFLPVLKDTTFLHVPYVEILNISKCNTTDAKLGTFSNCKRIHTVDVSQNYGLGFSNVSKAFYGLRNSPIEVLKMNNIYPLFGSCSRLDSKHIRYLQNTSLKELHINGNGIIEFQKGTLRSMPQSLEKMLARENRFSYGKYLFELASMPSLRYLDISNLNRWRPFPSKRDVKKQQQPKLENTLTILLPPKLETFILSHCYLEGGYRFQSNNSSLTNFTSDHNLLSFIYVPNNGLEKIKFVNLSYNTISNITLFAGIPMTSLDLSYNELDNGPSEMFIQNLTGLQHLNISANRISFLSRDIFKTLRQLQTLVMSNNEIENFDVCLKHMSHFMYLDLGSNKLESLPAYIQDDLDQLPNVTVRLKGNPLSCTCFNIDFLRWIDKNRPKFQELETTHCILSSGISVYLSDLDTVINDLEDQCRPYGSIFLTSMSLFILIIIIMSIATCYRYRWKLRRMYYVGRKKRQQVIDNEQEHYKFDAFVSYADSDRGFVKNVMISELEEKAGLKLCVHDRDFIPGTVIASNIANAIQNSRKTLVILSPSFLKSDWCQFEYNMARAEGVSRRENVVVAVLYRPVDPKDMPRDMALLFAQYSYLQYEMDGHDDEIFWQNISDAIGTPEPTDE